MEPLLALGSLGLQGGELGLNEPRHRLCRTLTHYATHKTPAALGELRRAVYSVGSTESLTLGSRRCSWSIRRALEKLRQARDSLRYAPCLLARQVIRGVLVAAGVKVIPVHDGTDEEAIGVLYPKAMLVLLHHPRRRESPEVVHRAMTSGRLRRSVRAFASLGAERLALPPSGAAE